MEFTYSGYVRHKNRITGKKVYSPILRRAMHKRRSRRWFLRAREAADYGTIWAARATAQLAEREPA